MSRYKFETKHIRILRIKFLKFAIVIFQSNLTQILLQDIAFFSMDLIFCLPFCVLYFCYFFSCINVICGVCQLRLPWEIRDFCLKTFLPEIRLATSNLRPLPEDEMKKLRGNFLGTVIKLAYGGIWEVSCI